MADLIEAIDADKDELEQLMDGLGVPQDRFKVAGAWMAEKIGRLKLNGQITGYSPLSRLVELEGLALGIEGKKSLWKSLARLQGSDPRLSTVDLDLLVKRAEEQLELLEPHRQEAALNAFS